MTIVQDIVLRKIPAVIVYESDHVIAFADHDPINFGHLLICPKEPFSTFLDLPDDILYEVHSVAKQLYQRIEKKFLPDAISMIQNNGFFNELNHYHLHIFPRYKNDEFLWTNKGAGVQSIDALKASLIDF